MRIVLYTQKSFALLFATLTFMSGVVVFGFDISQAAEEQKVQELQNKIEDRSSKLEELEEEIEQYENELVEVGQEKQTLSNTIKTLDVSQKKLSTEIKVTENEIKLTDQEVRELELEIREKELLITRDEEAMASSLRNLNELDQDTFIETLLKNDNLSDFWDEMEKIQSFQFAINSNLKTLTELKAGLERTRDKTHGKMHKLGELKDELSGEHSALKANIREKDVLLDQTKNKEANYQSLLQEKRAARDQFLRELKEFESQLEFILNPATIPAIGSGVLAWPFTTEYMLNCPSYISALGNEQCITQYFGNTAFASGGAYNGKGHNGIDFRAPPGTKVTSALAGTVTGTGNTDAASGCYSYGKWVLVKHNNGLSTLYAHLSSISVNPGQAVATGGLIGYSGNTGYSTGPHLHFSVYATEGVNVQKLGDIPGRPITGCSPVSIPVAGLEAYLNPLNYL